MPKPKPKLSRLAKKNRRLDEKRIRQNRSILAGIKTRPVIAMPEKAQGGLRAVRIAEKESAGILGKKPSPDFIEFTEHSLFLKALRREVLAKAINATSLALIRSGELSAGNVKFSKALYRITTQLAATVSKTPKEIRIGISERANPEMSGKTFLRYMQMELRKRQLKKQLKSILKSNGINHRRFWRIFWEEIEKQQ